MPELHEYRVGAPYDAATYDRLLDALYRRYPSSEALLAIASARCTGGAE